MNEAALHRRLEKLGAAVAAREVTKERQKLKRRHREEVEAIRARATKDAQASARREAATAAKEAKKQSRREIDLVKERAAKELAQHALESRQFKAKVDELSLKLERQTSDQMGEMAEADAFAALRNAFPQDDIQRIGRGVRGADILHRVIVDGTEAGRIIYECKNVTSWANEWLAKARTYRSEYQTPWVVIAARCFPRRQKWFVVERGVPIIDLRLIVKLAEVLRAAVVEIGQLRTSSIGRQAKAEQMFAYVLSDHFAARFKGVAEAIAALRDQQSSERQWHAKAWAKQTRLYDEMDDGRREIGARIRTIADATTKPRLRVLAGDR
jgi:hypothetical protein